MKKPPFYRRHPLLSSLILILMSAIVLLAVALTQIDLDSVRQRLTRELSHILQQPVRIEKLHLTYNNGLAIDIHNLQIGDQKALDARIPRLTGTLKLEPLLDGELKLDQIILEQPRIKVTLVDGIGDAARKSAHSRAGNLLNRFGISILNIRNGQLKAEWDKPEKSKIPAEIENLNLILRGWTTDSSGYLVISGNLPQQQGRFTVETELPPPAQLASWQSQELSFDASLKDIPRNLLPDEAAQHLPERFDVSIQLTGAPTRGSKIQGALKESRTGRTVTSLEGTWKTAEQLDILQFQRLILFDIPMQGTVQISRKPDTPLMQGELTTENIQLPQVLKRWDIPQIENLHAGTLTKANILFSTASSETESGKQLQYQANLSLSNGRWALTEEDSLEQIALNVTLDNQALEVTDGTSLFREQPMQFSGEVHNWKSDPLFSLDISTRPELAPLKTLIKDLLPENLSLDGATAAHLKLEGSRELVRGDLQIDLDNLQGEWSPLLSKKAGQPGQLTVTGSWQAEQLDIELAKLNFADLQLEGTAEIPLQSDSHPISIQLNNFDLDALRPHSPLLQRLKAQGSVNIGLQKHPSGEILGRLKLNNVGAHLTKILADINSVTGTADFHQQGIDFNNLDARLGESPVKIDGSLRNWKNFLLDLQVRAPQIRAQDLIFANQEMTVYDLDGRLLINKGGIIFDPVNVRLENGTDATVTGYVRNFKQPDTYLEIDSYEFADILEVINLFAGPPKIKQQSNNKKKVQPKPVRILARAAKGTLGGLNFQQAEGMIVNHRGLFTLYPLHFRHKDGYCQARVELENGRLKISGHVEDIDASVIYKEALGEKGLITGKLRGDFYLEGNGTGEKFWASSKGGAHLEVRDGALRKFRSLARVFSLLNVSQLFELKLPDMDSKGMPFTLTTASATIDNGVLATENLHIQSNAMNMSLIGSRDILNDTIDLTVGVKPLRTVDKIITSIPVAGWLLAGKEKALLTAHFQVKGPADDPSVTAIPVSSLSKTVLGLVKRTLELPGTFITDPEKLFFPGAEEAPGKPTHQPQTAEPKNTPETEENPVE